MTTLSTNSGERRQVNIKNLFLDPNNYRFIDNKNYKSVSLENIENDDIQKRTRLFIIEEKRNGVKDIIDSFKANGYLEVDQIQVEEFAENKYRVIEGNRRVASLKELADDNNKGIEIGNLNEKIFKELPVILYPKAEAGHVEIVMGLKHINGNKKWALLNQAQLLSDLTVKYNWTEDRICNSLGITKQRFRRSLRTLSLIEDFRKSDYGDKFENEMFAIFEEIITSQDIKKWIEWDDENYKPLNQKNTERLYSWLVEVEDYSDEEKPDREIKLKEKIVIRSKDIRDISKFIFDEQAVAKMEETRSLMDAYLVSDKVGTDKFDNSLEIIGKQIDEAHDFLKYAKSESKDTIQELLNKLEGLALSKGFKEIIFSKNRGRDIFVDFTNSGFNDIHIVKYKKFENVLVRNLNRINVFAGDNNSGKSSILELIYLLAKQNDLNAFFDIYRRRGKFLEQLPINYIKKEFNTEFEIASHFDNKEINYKSLPIFETGNVNDSYYKISIEIKSSFAGEILYSKAQIFDNETKMESKKIRWICNATLSSPFSSHNADDIYYCYNRSVETKIKDSIINFIQNHIDINIQNIEPNVEIPNHFWVTHSLFESAVDLTRFGDGLQRIFYILLQIAASTNGIMCIDELENAIHHSLLEKFVDFLQKLAEKYSVQVFITSHSKECIDTFVNNNYNLENISFYQLAETEVGIKFKYASGTTMKKLMSLSDSIDLRGSNSKEEEE